MSLRKYLSGLPEIILTLWNYSYYQSFILIGSGKAGEKLRKNRYALIERSNMKNVFLNGSKNEIYIYIFKLLMGIKPWPLVCKAYALTQH